MGSSGAEFTLGKTLDLQTAQEEQGLNSMIMAEAKSSAAGNDQLTAHLTREEKEIWNI